MDSAKNKRVPLTGYSDRLSARPGDDIQFKLSSTPQPSVATPDEKNQDCGTTVTAKLYRSVSADPNPQGPGIIEHDAEQWFSERTLTVPHQPFTAGSYGVSAPMAIPQSCVLIQLQARIWPTLQCASTQSIVSFGPLCLCLTANNTLALMTGDLQVCSIEALELRRWSQVQATLEKTDTHWEVTLSWSAIVSGAATGHSETVTHRLSPGSVALDDGSSHPVTVAARLQSDQPGQFFNGKIEAPELQFARRETPPALRLGWNFSHQMSSCTVPGLNTATPSLRLINFPARAMTGSGWAGQEMCWRHAPELYGAIHFHEDDIVDFNWSTTLTWRVPEGMPSGVYVLRISDGVHEDALPFYICAPKGQCQHELCVLIPTFTYAIYGNHARPDWQPQWQDKVLQWQAYPYNPAEYPGYGLSTYNYHTDGSGICHASHRRPLFNLRPGYLTFGASNCSGLRHFQADSHLLSWLEAKGIGFDVITDRELHEEGLAAIEHYKHVMTTTHPEYHTAQTLDALMQYRDGGAHLSYLGGNGFYWRIAIHPEHEDVLEIRRAEDGIRAWAAEPGEYYQAFDGQYGGLWRRNGRPPQALCGLGFSGQGQFNGSYYRRKAIPESLGWVFEGIEEPVIGEFGLSGGGAAGFELDRADTHLGTPQQATILATSEAHGSDFMLVPEEMLTHITTLPGPEAAELIHADIIWFEVPGGGTVFSTGSITFCGSLPSNGYDNNISRLLLNVVNHVSSR